MARLIRLLRTTKTQFSTPKTLSPQLNNYPFESVLQTRNYITEMRKSAFQENILRLIRNEIQYEFDRSPPKPPVTMYRSFAIDERPGEQWMTMKRRYGENEEIKVEATMFDGAVPSSKSSDRDNNDMKLHLTMVVTISKGDGDSALEIMCSAWPDSLQILKLFVRNGNVKEDRVYVGPGFNDLDDELQDKLYDFLEVRGIDDQMGEFLHEYMKNKDKTEYIRWMGTVKSYIEK